MNLQKEIMVLIGMVFLFYEAHGFMCFLNNGICVKQKYCPGRAIQTFRCMWNDEVCCLVDGPFETTKRTTKLITVSSTYAPPIIETTSIVMTSVETPELSIRSDIPEPDPVKEEEIKETNDIEETIADTTEISEDTTENDTETNEETSPEILEPANSLSESDMSVTTKKYTYNKKKYPKKKV